MWSWIDKYILYMINTSTRKYSDKNMCSVLSRHLFRLFWGNFPPNVLCNISAYHKQCFNPLKGRDVNWLHFTRSNLHFQFSDIRALWRSGLSAIVPECQKSKMVGQSWMALNNLKCNHLMPLHFKKVSSFDCQSNVNFYWLRPKSWWAVYSTPPDPLLVEMGRLPIPFPITPFSWS